VATSKQQVDIVIFTEHVARELDVATALKYLIERKFGLKVAVRSIVHGLTETLHDLAMPKVVAIPYAYSAFNDSIGQTLAAWPKSVYINLHYEQFFDKTSAYVCGPMDEFARHRVMHLAWGEFFVEFLLAHGTQGDGIILNGNPALALYREPYSRFYETRDELAARFGLDPAKRWIFMPESFSMAFVEDGVIESMVYAGANDTEVRVSRKQASVALREVAHWLKFAAEKADVEIIVRPHPVVPLAQFTNAFIAAAGPLPQHLHFIKDGTVREWILACDANCASFSTTMIDSAVAGKPTYLLRPLPFSEATVYPWHKLVPKVRTLADFMQVVLGRVDSDDWRWLQKWAVDTMLSQGDVIMNLANVLAAAYYGDERLPRRVREGGDPFTTSEIDENAKSRLHPLWATRKHEMDRYTDEDVAQRVARWERALAA
jgi:surface carbohydrate biosynthesis protein